MAVTPAIFTHHDLERAAEALGTRHVELSPEGQLIVSPASDEHEFAIGRLAQLLQERLAGQVWNQPPMWRPEAGSGATRVPDLLVLRPGTVRRAELDFTPAPLLVVEVASPSTRSADRSTKADDHLAGGAAWYLLIDLPGLAPVQVPTAALWSNRGDRWDPGSPQMELLLLPPELGGGSFDLIRLVLRWG